MIIIKICFNVAQVEWKKLHNFPITWNTTTNDKIVKNLSKEQMGSAIDFKQFVGNAIETG